MEDKQKTKKLVVLISGNGSNLQAIIDAIERHELAAKILAVISNQREAFGLKRAEDHQLSHHTFPYGKKLSRQDYDAKLAELVLSYQPDYVVLAGWLRLLSMAFLRHFPKRVINLHPAKPNTFPGLHAIERAFEAYQQGKITETGVMVHFVPDEGVDDGPVILWEKVAIYPSDDVDVLRARIRQVEHQLLIQSLRQLP
ncbi:MAG: phosphoribosylglycinamide formyltransferase [Deinococcales bacterium]